ncbi:MAG: hypothetical protein AAFV29_16740 [Myxococcota bacterium]
MNNPQRAPDPFPVKYRFNIDAKSKTHEHFYMTGDSVFVYVDTNQAAINIRLVGITSKIIESGERHTFRFNKVKQSIRVEITKMDDPKYDTTSGFCSYAPKDD